MSRLPSLTTGLWLSALGLLLACASLWLWRERIWAYNETLKQTIATHASAIEVCNQQSAQCQDKAKTLTSMRAKRFVGAHPQGAFLQKQLLTMGKKHHLEKMRFEAQPKVCTGKVCKTTVTLYLQSALDTDVYAFMKDVHNHGPWTMVWTGVGLFKTPQETVQGDLKAEFYSHDPS
ncbi:MAG: hypothetical protein C0514_07915 [Candidatus Puniceispirillum sp.]|nr:hypothetical protein [Candidatus Puniceispirillum sp.]